MSASLKNAIFHSEKINKISDKLQSISVEVENDKYARVESVDQRLNNLNEQIDEYTELMNKKFNIVRENLSKINRSLEEDNQQN